jgi:hypothetical protein
MKLNIDGVNITKQPGRALSLKFKITLGLLITNQLSKNYTVTQNTALILNLYKSGRSLIIVYCVFECLRFFFCNYILQKNTRREQREEVRNGFQRNC